MMKGPSNMYMQGTKSSEDGGNRAGQGARNVTTFESEEEIAKRRMRQEKYHKEQRQQFPQDLGYQVSNRPQKNLLN